VEKRGPDNPERGKGGAWGGDTPRAQKRFASKGGGENQRKNQGSGGGEGKNFYPRPKKKNCFSYKLRKGKEGSLGQKGGEDEGKGSLGTLAEKSKKGGSVNLESTS